MNNNELKDQLRKNVEAALNKKRSSELLNKIIKHEEVKEPEENVKIITVDGIPLLRAIKKYCLQCSGGVKTERDDCQIENCPLHLYRKGITK